MRISSSMFAALVISLAGCAATENKTGEAVRPQQPVPDKVPAVATAIPRATASEGDDLSAIRDPNNPLSKRSIYFDFDNYEVKSEYAALLERHGRFLAEKPAVSSWRKSQRSRSWCKAMPTREAAMSTTWRLARSARKRCDGPCSCRAQRTDSWKP